MKAVHPLACAIATALAFAATPAIAAPPDSEPAGTKQFSTSLTPQQRGDLTRQFVLKWGAYVQTVYGIDAHTWASQMVSTFATADPVNFQQALLRSTYEGAVATLDGLGSKTSDDGVISILASSDGTVTPNALGDLDKDLVYTPIAPCRIVDTRASTPITGGTYRLFTIGGTTDFSVYGGSATDCGMTTQNPKAIVVNMTAVTPPATGYATLYPSLIATPLAASMIYQAGGVLSNAVTTRVANNDNVRLFSEHTVHYVVDLVGYYDAPYATALDCVNTTGTSINLTSADRNGNASAPACAAGYTRVAAHVGANGDFQNLFTRIQGSFYAYMYYGGSTSAEALVYSRCCRVPGR
ncbi:hypothetical protein [Luteimonas vadosa]|uniref:Uncharacterized protein n=1 Tax=Luteimonas vadosa TaxID=1165507 RepID=A0ABP9DN54_9GAMM